MPMQISISNAIKGQASSGGSSFASTNSFEFDGSTDYVNCGNNATLSPTTELSISAWFKTSATSYQIIASKTYYRVDIINGSGRLVFVVYNSPSNFTSVYTPINTSYQDGQWHHVLCTHQVNGRHKIYVDGVLLADATSSPSNIFVGSTPFIIGNKNTSSSFRFNGNIDEVAFWDSELSASDVTNIYNSGVPNDLTSLSPVSWWRMGEAATYNGREWELVDQGSGGNNGFSVTLPAPPTAPSTDVPT